MKILVVEDSPATRALVVSTIESGAPEAEVVEAATGFEALKMLPHHAFEAIVTDINMPDVNGLELVSFVKAHPEYRSIPVMVISTESAAEDRARATALGADDYLVKPFQSAELIDKLLRILHLP